MTSFHNKQLHADAKASLQHFGNRAGKLILIYAGVSLCVNLLLTLISYALDFAIDGTSGLADISTIALLEAIETFLSFLQVIAMPFWSIGYVYAMMQTARRESADSVNLLAGFRHFGPVLRTTFLRLAIYFALAMVGMQIAGLVYMLFPSAKELLRLTEELTRGTEIPDYNALLENEAYMAAMMPAIPLMIIGAILPIIPLFYRMRLMDYVLMDEPRHGAFYAFGRSMRLTRKKCMAIFKLDLRFWWFYLLELLSLAICFGDVLLPLVGISLPMEPAQAALVFYLVGILCQFGLYLWKQNQVSATYALLYDALRTESIPAPQPAASTSVPWKY